jgi:hypothetical protein
MRCFMYACPSPLLAFMLGRRSHGAYCARTTLHARGVGHRLGRTLATLSQPVNLEVDETMPSEVHDRLLNQRRLLSPMR